MTGLFVNKDLWLVKNSRDCNFVVIKTRCLIKECYFSTNSGTMKVLLSMLCLLYAVEGYTLANKTKLHQDLFTNYKKKFRPGDDQIIPTELMFSFYIRSLKERQESNEIMVVVGSLGLEWKDFRLSWNPLDYGGNLNQTSVLVDDIWKPYLVLMNPYEEINPILSGGFSCKLWYNGYVSCLPPPNMFEALCTANLTKYPYDDKNCSLQLYVSGYFNSDLNLTSLSSTFNTDIYIGNGQWSITSTDICVHSGHIGEESYEILRLEINLKRIPGAYLWYLSPMFVLSGMQILVFFMPQDSEMRVEFSITVLLTEVVFLTVIQENIPRGSTDVPILVYKQFSDMFISFLTLIGVLVVNCLNTEPKTKQPQTTEETPDELIVQSTRKKLCAMRFDMICLVIILFFILLSNALFYDYVSEE